MADSFLTIDNYLMSEFWDSIVSWGKSFAQKTGEAAEVGRVRVEITNLNNKINRLHRKIGETVETRYTQGGVDISLASGVIGEMLKDVGVYRSTIATLEKKLDRK